MPVALHHPAIQQYALARDFDQVARTRHLARRTVKHDVHENSPIGQKSPQYAGIRQRDKARHMTFGRVSRHAASMLAQSGTPSRMRAVLALRIATSKDEFMHKHLLTPIALAVGAALAVSGCSNNAQNQASSAPAASASAPAPAHTAPAPASTVAIPADQPIAFTLDDQYNPCNDFDQYVNSKWNTANPIPADQTRWGAFGILHEKSLLQQKQILETAANDAKNKS